MIRCDMDFDVRFSQIDKSWLCVKYLRVDHREPKERLPDGTQGSDHNCERSLATADQGSGQRCWHPDQDGLHMEEAAFHAG